MAALRAAELEVLFTANTDPVEKAAKEVKQTGDKIEKNPIKVGVDAKDALAGMDRVETAAKKIVSAKTIATVDANIDRAEKSFVRVFERLDYLRSVSTELDVSADIKRAEANLSKVQRSLEGLRNARATMEVDADTAPAEAAIDDLEDSAVEGGRRGGLDAGSALIGGIVGALASTPIVGAIAGLAHTTAEAIGQAFEDGLAIEVGFDRLEALTGIGPEDALRLGRAAGEAYANVFGDSIESNMDTARLALQFDIIDEESTTRSAQKVVESLSGIADVLGEDVRPIAQAVTVMLSSGIAKSADEAFDILAAGAREGVNRSEDLLDTFTEYPALFSRLGLTGEEALGLINQGLDAGAFNSDKVADALKELQIRATDASETSAEGYRLIGLNAEEMTAKMAAGGAGAKEGLDQILDSLRGIEDPVARNVAGVALVGAQWEDLGDSILALDLSTAVEQLGGVEGAAQRMFDTLSGNDATKIEGAKRNIEVAVEGIQGALATAFSEPLGGFAEWVAENRGPLLEFLQGLVDGAFEFGHTLIDAAASGTEAFGGFVSGPLAGLTEALAQVVSNLNFGDDKGLGDLSKEMRGFKDEANVAADNISWLHNELYDAQDAFDGFADGAVSMGYLNDASLRLASSLDAVGVDAEGAALSLEGVDVANLDASESGRLLEEQVRSAIAALSDEVTAAEASGEAQEALTERYDAGTEALVGQLTQMGLTEEQARALIDTVLQTPTDATTAYASNAPEEQGKVQSLADRITTLPDGSIVIAADDSPARATMDQFFRTYNGQTVAVNVNATPGRNYADGAVVEYMAYGGLTPMQPIAQVVPANTWRVVGDRPDVSESFIPHDGSPRSLAILYETMRRMGVTPMATGGVAGVAGSQSQAVPAIVVQLLQEIAMASRRPLSVPLNPVQSALGSSNVSDTSNGRM